MKNLIIKINNPSHFEGNTADYAIVTLDEKSIARIKELAAAVISLNIYKAVEFDCPCSLMEVDYDASSDNGKEKLKEPNIGSDCETLDVTATDFFWSGYYKNIDAKWETKQLPLSVLEEPGDIDQREND